LTDAPGYHRYTSSARGEHTPDWLRFLGRPHSTRTPSGVELHTDNKLHRLKLIKTAHCFKPNISAVIRKY